MIRAPDARSFPTASSAATVGAGYRRSDGCAMVVKPAGFGSFLTVERDPDSPDARRSGRYTVKEFGFRIGLQSTLDAFRAARE